MMNAFKPKAKRCCSAEHEQLVRRLVACEMEAKSSGQRHACYRQEARKSGRRSRKCMAAE